MPGSFVPPSGSSYGNDTEAFLEDGSVSFVFYLLEKSGRFCSLHDLSGVVYDGGRWSLVMDDGHVMLEDGVSCGEFNTDVVFSVFSYASVQSLVIFSSPVVLTKSIALPDLKQ